MKIRTGLIALALVACGGAEDPRVEALVSSVAAAPRPAPRRPPRVRMEAREVDGALPPELVRQTVDKAFDAFNVCFQRSMREHPQLSGRLDLDFLIDEGGLVAGVKGNADLPDPVVDCIVNVFRSLEFPSPRQGTVVVAYAVELIPGDP